MGGVASTIAALGNGTADGDIGHIRVTQGGETHLQRLTWDATNSKWISEPLPVVISGKDGDWMSPLGTGTLTAQWGYLGAPNSSDAGWALRAGGIPFVGALFASGLQLQDRLWGRFGNTSATTTLLSPWFYEFDDSDTVVFDNDRGAVGGKTWNGLTDTGFMPATGNLGHGAVLENSATTILFRTNATYGSDAVGGYNGLTRNAGWDYVKFFVSSTPSGSALGGVPTTTPYTPTKKYLYPTLYGSLSSQRVAAVNYEVRWTT